MAWKTILIVVVVSSICSVQSCTNDCICQQERVECRGCTALPDKADLPRGSRNMLFFLSDCDIATIESGYFDGIATEKMHIYMEDSNIFELQSNLLVDPDIILQLTLVRTILQSLANTFHVRHISEVSAVRSTLVGFAKNAFRVEEQIDKLYINQTNIGKIESNAISATIIKTIELVERSAIETLNKHAFRTSSIELFKMASASQIIMDQDLALENVELGTLDVADSFILGEYPFTGLSYLGSMQILRSSMDVLRNHSIAERFLWSEGSYIFTTTIGSIEEGTFDGQEMSEDSVCDIRVHCDQQVHWMMTDNSTLPEAFFRAIICYNLPGPSGGMAILHTCSLENEILVDCDYIDTSDIMCY